MIFFKKLLNYFLAGMLFQGIFISCTQHAKGQDSPQWGEQHTRNMISAVTGLPDTFNPETGENIKWVADIGSHGYATPVVANGKVLIGANNAASYDERHEGDRGTLLCFSENDGSFLWQLTVPRIEGDRHHD